MPVHIFDIFNIFDIFKISPGSSGGPVLPVFQANVPNQFTGFMDDVAIGVGGLTELRDGSLWVEDFEGVSQEFGPREVARSGGRVTGDVGSRQVSWKDENGDPLPQLPRIVHAPEASNQVVDSTTPTFATTALIAVELNTITSPSGFVDACRLIPNSVVASHKVSPISASTQGGLATTSIFAKPGELHRVSVQNYQSAASFTNVNFDLSAETAELRSNGSNGIVGEFGMRKLGNGWFDLFITCDHPGLASADFFVVYVKPDSWDVDPGNGVDGMYFWQPQLNYGHLSLPIPTYGAPLSRPACAMSFDAANHDDAEGSYYIEAATTGDCMILGGFVSQVGSDIELSDGTNVQTLPADPGAHKIGIVYGSGTMKLNVDGAWSAEVPYDGTLLQGELDLFRDADVMGYAGTIERYATKHESIIDGLMA